VRRFNEKLAQLWFHLEKIHLHATSEAYIPPRVLFKSDLAATTLSCQQAQKVSKSGVWF
jgi:hypothetical protein